MKFYLHLSWTQAHVSTTTLVSLVCPLLSRLYHAEKLPKTNLVFIITDAKLTCLPCDATLLKQEEEQCILLPNRQLSSGSETCTFDSVNRCFKSFVFDEIMLDRTDYDM